MILNDNHINYLANKGMIQPYTPGQIRGTAERPQISSGLSSFGYDVTLAETVKCFTNTNQTVIDPKQDNDELIDLNVHTSEDGSRYVMIPPHSYVLGHTVEIFDIPNDVMVLCVGKSTYARKCQIVNVTPIEAGFKGQVVIEIANTTGSYSKVYVNEGIAQFVFFQGERCGVSYADRNGKYQYQQGITTGRV